MNERARPILTLDHIHYAYPNGVQAVSDLSMELRPSAITGLIGPSGCGKSTVLSLIAGMASPASGDIRWAEDHELGPRGRRLTMVFQKDTLMPWLTVEKNVGFGLRFLDLSAREKRERVDRMLEMAGLGDRRHAYPRELSGGMRRRVAFVAGVAPLPRVLLLDEPFSALDEPTRVGIHAEVLRIVRELDMTVLLVSHDLGEVITLCDQVHLLSARPAHVAVTREVDIANKDDPNELRESEPFHRLYREMWHELSLQTAAPAPRAVPDHGEAAP